MRYRTARPLPPLLGIIIGHLLCACSNSDGVDYANYAEITTNSEEYWNTKVDYLPLDDSEYPYAGIPRIVIETENHQEIKDRETEIPAKLQIWGESAPESEIMDLTIRGRGNTSWIMPKKPYAIKFNEKQAFLGMPKAKKWVLLANYRDRTLIRNALAFKIAEIVKMEWVPQGKFVELFINGSFAGNYYLCEKIQIDKNRLNLSSNSFLLELDSYYDEPNKFRTRYKDFPVCIKSPKDLTDSQYNYIKNFIDTAECHLYGECSIDSAALYFDISSFAKFWIVQGVSANGETNIPKSYYVYKDSNLPLKAGPVWDFDWETFSLKYPWFRAENSPWISKLKKTNSFKKEIKQIWNKKDFSNIDMFIDSLIEETKESNAANQKKWPIRITTGIIGDETISLDSAIFLMKKALHAKIQQMDSIINEL